MPDNLIQVGIKADPTELQTAMEQSSSAVHEHAGNMAKEFEKLAQTSKTALDDLSKAAKLSGLSISDELQGVLDQVPKLINGIGAVFSGGGIGAFVGVLLQAGIALKGLFDQVIALKGAKEEWAEIDQRLAGAEDSILAKLRRDAVEHIRLTQGQAAASAAAIKLADQELVPLGKDIEQILAGKNAKNLSEGLKKDFEGFQHITFGELPQKISDVEAAIKRSDDNVKKLNDRFLESVKFAPIFGELGKTITGFFGAALEKAQGENKQLHDLNDKAILQLKEKAAQTANQVKQQQQQQAEEFREAQQKQLQSLKQGLQDQKDAQDAFHTLSKQAEVKYWDDIIATNKVKGGNLKEVQRLRSEAKKEADRQELKDEFEKTQDEVAAAKAGSEQRVRILAQEIEKLKAEHKDETEEYKRLVKEKGQADREFSSQTLRNEVEQVRETVEATRAGSLERVRILGAEITKLASENKTDTEEYKRLVREKIQAEKEWAAVQEALREEVKRNNQQHTDALLALEKSRLDFERQTGQISESEYERRLLRQIEVTFRAQKEQQEIELRGYQEGTKAFAKAKEEQRRLEDKFQADVQKVEQQSLLRQRQQFGQQFQQISSQFNTAINGWIQGTETASQAFTKLFQSVLQGLIGFVEQWIENKAKVFLADHLFAQQSDDDRAAQLATNVGANTTEAESAAGLAGANTLAAASIIDPFIAPEIADANFSAAQGFAGIAGFALGGIVPADGIARLHRGETVIPANLSGKGDFGGALGQGGGVTVVVNHSVNAIDAASFQTTIKKHGNLIGNEVVRVLKQRGFGGK
ncbi:MAG TPA: hypothetical protein VFK06_10920 [Candidatus Angelobacter sp.]|nr:hypothetical protein [Candidatus Angelobacter sp.]